MTNLTEAEKAHGWSVTFHDLIEWRGGDIQVRPGCEFDLAVCISGDSYTTEHRYWKEPDVDRLILALLQAKGILRRASADMTNTTHEGEL